MKLILIIITSLGIFLPTSTVLGLEKTAAEKLERETEAISSEKNSANSKQKSETETEAISSEKNSANSKQKSETEAEKNSANSKQKLEREIETEREAISSEKNSANSKQKSETETEAISSEKNSANSKQKLEREIEREKNSANSKQKLEREIEREKNSDNSEQKLEREIEREKNSDNSEQKSETEIESLEAETEEEAEITAEEREKQEKLAEADRLYLEGNQTEAAQIYQQVKEAFAAEKTGEIKEKRTAIYEPEKLNGAGAVYWNLYQEGLEQPELKSKTIAPLKLITANNPEFIPGHLHYVEILEKYEREEEVFKVLERAVSLYPEETELVRVKIAKEEKAKKWLEASLTARKYALFNRDRPDAAEFTEIAEKNLKRYRNRIRENMAASTVAGVAMGALSYGLTGSLFGPFSALETSMLLLRGESGIGSAYTRRIKRRLPILEDEEVNNYVREIADKIIPVTGRDDFEYEFYVINDDRLNAFALPGGKIFIYAGAILETNSEAELAGLIAHEISHSVLSHSFQLITRAHLTRNITHFIPYVGGLTGNLVVLNYSREMEREADIYGTKLLVGAGYAADGVRNLMVTIADKSKKKHPPAWLSTHPDTKDRISYIEAAIVNNNFDRYAYEGVTRHAEIKEKVALLWKEYSEELEEEENKDKKQLEEETDE